MLGALKYRTREGEQRQSAAVQQQTLAAAPFAARQNHDSEPGGTDRGSGISPNCAVHHDQRSGPRGKLRYCTRGRVLVRQSIYAYAARDVNLSHTLTGDFWVHDAIDRGAVESVPFPGKDTRWRLSGRRRNLKRSGLERLNVIHTPDATTPSVTAAIAAVGVPPSVKPIASAAAGYCRGGSGSQ